MTTFLDLAGDDSDVAVAPAPAPKKKESFADLAGPPPKAATFSEVADPAKMRADILAHGGSGPEGRALLAAFDAKYPNAASAPAVPVAAPARPVTPAAAGEWRLPGSGDRGPAVNAAPNVEPPETLWDKAKGAIGTAATTIASPFAAAAGNLATVYDAVTGPGAMNSPEVMQRSDQVGGAVTQKLLNWITAGPQNSAGQRYTEAVGKVAEPLQALGPMVAGPEMAMAGRAGAVRLRDAGDSLRAGVSAGEGGLYSPKRIEPTAGAPSVPKPPEGFDSPPAAGGVSPAAADARAAVLKRVGVQTVKDNVLKGDALSRSTDAQLAKSDEPIGVAAKAQFAHEKQALTDHATRIVGDTGGTLGMDEDALNTRGQTIAAPFDALRKHFDDATTELYKQADQRSQGMPTVQPKTLEGLLNDRSFKNQLTATNQGHLLSGVADELANFKETNPQGLTPKNAEQFRQFLNTLWSPETSGVIGKMKGALDKDVFQGAGEDIYGAARDLHAKAAQTLDNPNGVAKLFEADPNTPINRTTPFHKIPDTLSRMSPDQFKNVIDTLKGMPAELQPQAQAAISEIQAHFANKVLDAGLKNTGVNASWNAPGVSQVMKGNSAKLPIAFADKPEALAKLQDLESAGKILQFDGSYPGAAVQAAALLKRGALSTLTQRAATGAGAGLGGLITGNPLGAAGGATLGEIAGGAMGKKMADRAALKKWNAELTTLKDLAR